MALIDQLPSPEGIRAILDPVIGDENAGTGVAGVAKLLEGIDTAGLSASLAGQLGDAVSFRADANGSALTSGVVSEFQQAISLIPSDPSNLVSAVRENLERIQELSSQDLPTALRAGVDGLANLQDLLPSDAGTLVSDLAEPLNRLKGEFISGEFGQLQQWSASIVELNKEIAPLLTGGPGTVEGRLIGFLRAKIEDLVQQLVPGPNLAMAIRAEFDGVIDEETLGHITGLKTEVMAAIDAARSEFEQGHFSNTAHLQTAQAKFRELSDSLADLAGRLNAVLDSTITNHDDLMAAIARQLDALASIEFVDLGNVRDKFAAAIERAEEAVRDLELDAVAERIESLFGSIDDTVSQFSIDRLLPDLESIRGKIDLVLARIEAVWLETVAAVRLALGQVTESLEASLTTLGAIDETGQFQFHVQQDMEDFLTEVRDTVTQVIRPMIEEFRSSVGQTLESIQSALNATRGQIESVKAELQGALEGLHAELQSLDVKGRMEEIRLNLDGMLSRLGAVDFDPVVDPVIAQIEDMRGTLKKIDVSSMGEVQLGALKLSASVVLELDFAGKITDALLTEIDKILDIPRNGLGEIEARVETALQRLSELEPESLLSPLDELFGPIIEKLDSLDLAILVEPLETWHADISAEVARVSPASLLQPLVDLHAELERGTRSLSASSLVEPVQGLIDEVKGEIERVDVSGATRDVAALVDEIGVRLDEISPTTLLEPLVAGFDKIMEVLDQFDPAALLKPFSETFDALSAPLANLTAEHAQQIGEVFEMLRRALESFDPQAMHQAVHGQMSSVSQRLDQMNVGGLIAELRQGFSSLQTSFEANAGPADVDLTASIQTLNPLRNEAIGRLSNEVQRFQTRVRQFADSGPDQTVVARYGEFKDKLDSLRPSWASPEMRPATVRAAFAAANPLKFEAEVDALYGALKQQLRAFDPRAIQERLDKSMENAKAALLVLDSTQIANEVESVVTEVTERLDAIDLELLVAEIDDVTAKLENIVAAFDPAPIVERLEGLTQEVTDLVGALDPAEMLAPLSEPLEQSKQIVAEFDPTALKEPIVIIFADIQQILDAVDVGVVLQPLSDRLEEIRDELERALRRTEESFKGMLKAIPV